MKDHEEPLHDLNFVPAFDEIEVEYDPGSTINVIMHDGSSLRMHKLEEEYDPTDRIGAIRRLMQSHQADEVLTGVFYLNTQAPDFIEVLNLVDEPLATLPESVIRPSRAVLEECMEELR
jgi:2-oxoglutarate ferredoxin oxidoreductase subunit beta